MMWLSACVLAGVGLVCSTMAGWHVASLMTVVLAVVAHAWPPVVDAAKRYGLFSTSPGAGKGALDEALVEVHDHLFRGLGSVLPDFGRFDYGDSVARGVRVAAGTILQLPDGALWYAAVYLLAAGLLGYVLFVRKEVGR